MVASMTMPLASVNVPFRASSVTRSFCAVRLPLTLILPLTDFSRMLPSPGTRVPAVTGPVANVPSLTKVTSPPGFDAEVSVPTLLATLPRVTVPAELVTMRLVAVMAADWVMVPAAVRVTMLPAIPATSKPLRSV